MKHLTWRRPRHRWAVTGLAIVALGLLGVAIGVSRPTQTQAAPAKREAVDVSLPTRTQAAPAAHAAVASKPAATRKPEPKPVASPPDTTRRQMPNPVRISIPSIGVDAPVIRLGLNPDRTIEVPKDFAETGWFELGPEPGEQGSAVIVGHLESLAGPGVFYNLRELRVGQLITIRLQDGSTVRYVADSMSRVPKSRFPTDRVYAQTKEPTLRLITCAGAMNPSTGYHPDNYIVFGSLAR